MILLTIMLAGQEPALVKEARATLGTQGASYVAHAVDPDGRGVRLFRAARHDRRVCVREGVYVQPVRPAPRVPIAQVALAKACGAVPPAGWATVQPEALAGEAAAALRWLAAAQARARHGGTAPRVTCTRTALGGDGCRGGAIAVLARLPLDRVFLIERAPGEQDWDVAIMPRGPGQLYYRARFAMASPRTLALEWRAPAPF